ncbi:glutamate-cysteine ligase family protein [Streptomyces atratus]|uniref:carboxylate-amine ligase n=1 Tax=Streptomyces atratus TaxID=1893 RepID=UPI00387335C3
MPTPPMVRAGAVGARTAAVGAVPFGAPIPMPVSDEPRCAEQLRDYRGPVAEHVICATQVHVGVPDRERAVFVSNHLRPWLPRLIALSANSPFFCGRDTGYASRRRMMGQRWPVSGPPPYFWTRAPGGCHRPTAWSRRCCAASARSGGDGDRETVVALLRRPAATGTGADRQRAVRARRGSLLDVVDAPVTQTPVVRLR